MPFIAAVLLLCLPWLNPFSLGPTPAVPTLLFSWACAALFFTGYGILGPYRSDRLTGIAVCAWLLAGLVSALIGLLQYFGHAGALDGWVNSTSVGEAFGNLRQRNHFATLTNIALAALVFCSVSLQSSARLCATPARLTVLRMLCLLAAALLAAGNAASSSRTGLMQLLLLLVLTSIWGIRSRREGRSGRPWVLAVVLGATFAYATAAVSFPVLAELDPQAIGILARLHDGGPACSGRLTLWSNVLNLIAQKPWFGWGWGELGYAHFITLYPGARFCDILDNAHNLPLHIAVELGVPLALTFCAVCCWLIWRSRPWLEANPTRQLAWTVLAMVALHSLLEYPLWYGPFQMAVVLSVWILWRTPPLHVRTSGGEEFDRAQQHRLGPKTVAVLGVLVMASIAYVGWDYWRIGQIYTAPAERAIAYQSDTLEKIKASWVFRNQVRFAELGITPLTPQNAEHSLALAEDLLHFSAEPQVVQRIVESAVMLHRDTDAQFYTKRFQAAFPQAYAQWSTAQSPQQEP